MRFFISFVLAWSYVAAIPTSPYGKYDVVGKQTNDGTSRFFVVGDWGGLPTSPFDTPSEVAVASAMGQMGLKLNTTFQLALGDNFYYDGVKAVNDSRFQDTFEHVFSATALQTPWYVLAGNHDHRGNVSAEIEYGKTSKRWIFPDYFYTFSLWQNDQQKKLVDFVMIDTVVLCGGDEQSDWDHQPLRGPKDRHVAETNWQWIEEQLRQSTAPYLIVGGHYPVYSIAEHGPTNCLIERLRPMLHQYNVTAYVCGHDHNLQHLVNTLNGVTMNYFVVGAANFIDPSQDHAKDVPADALKFFWAGSPVYGGFAVVEVNTTELTLTFVDHSEQTLYQSKMKPRF